MKQTIILAIAGVDFSFNVTVQDHSTMVDAINRGESMTATAHNFVMRTVDESNKTEIKELLGKSPGAEVQIATLVRTEFAPVLEITVKK
jgi:hypothetical protein